MNKKILVGVTALLFGVTLTGCQVHFDRDAVTFGKVESKKKKVTKKKVVKPKKTNQRVSNKTEIHNKVNKKVIFEKINSEMHKTLVFSFLDANGLKKENNCAECDGYCGSTIGIWIKLGSCKL